jgi:hypothetical protein
VCYSVTLIPDVLDNDIRMNGSRYMQILTTSRERDIPGTVALDIDKLLDTANDACMHSFFSLTT